MKILIRKNVFHIITLKETITEIIESFNIIFPTCNIDTKGPKWRMFIMKTKSKKDTALIKQKDSR